MNMRRLPFSEDASNELLTLIERDAAPEDMGFVILEQMQLKL